MDELYIDNEILIALVQERPVLWDYTRDIFKDKNATRNAWHEVCREIYSDFDELEETQRNDFGKEVAKRWKHLRDAFVKSEKRAQEIKASGLRGTKKRKYIFSDELKFLKKLYDKTETTESFVIGYENKDETDGSCQQLFEHSQREAKLATVTKGKVVCNIVTRKKLKKTNEVKLKALEKTTPEKPEETATEKLERTAPEKLEKTAPEKLEKTAPEKLEKTAPEKPEKTAPDKLKAQMSFYHSLLPHTENFNSDEWLQFQIEVLQAISNIKNQKAAIPLYQGYIVQSNECQPALYHLQPQPFTTQNALLSKPKQNRSTSTTLDSRLPQQDPSSSTQKKNEKTAAENSGCVNKYAGENDGERSSVDSNDSSSTTEFNF